MASDCAALGSFARLLVQDGSTPRTFNGSSERYAFIYETLGSRRTRQGRRRIVGSRDLYDRGMRPHSYVISGRLGLQPGPADLTKWLPRIFGSTFSSGTLVPGDELPSFDMLIDRENGIWLYTNCRVASAIFTAGQKLGSEEEELIELALTIVAETETDGQSWPGSPPEVPDAAANAPYGHWETSLTLNSNARLQDNFVLSIDNDIYMAARGSLTPNCIRAGDRSIRLTTRNPFTAATQAEALAMWSASLAGSLSFSSNNMSTVFSFPKLSNSYNTPNVTSKNEIPLELRLEAARTAADPTVTITHDATP
jgi:hypothetical protein